MNITEGINRIKQLMAGKGYKLTPQREVTLRVLLEQDKGHLSAEDVFMLVKARFPEMGLATVYRTLELLVELGVLVKVNFQDGVARYDLRCEEQHHMRHHLICNECGHLKKLQEDWLAELEERLQREYGFTVTDHRLDFIGTYVTCQQSSNCKRKEVS
ncbi:Fur family transcriptional regulator [Paenibacillus sp. J2TS4]|uniref:Fur family transcriptional regulator n=1 Tax=Paenibacillus sp. J2TS4 TaxID=2807194 RepID=UPI001B22F220|nr:Fur family transcriptional regulator [Paenibacillus sp. J2TS4]GIP31840.1 transcriptional repressor [Paenibacillus sp. J2TS4]